MSETRDPKELELEAAIRREVQRQLAQNPVNTPKLSADTFDFKAEPCNIYPGEGWFLVNTFYSGINVYILWAIPRTLQVQLKQEPIMPMVAPKAK